MGPGGKKDDMSTREEETTAEEIAIGRDSD